MVDFLHALYNGQAMTVTAGTFASVIHLTGSATGIAVLNQCRDTIVAQKTAPAPPTQPMPVAQPTQPMPVQPKPTAQSWAVNPVGGELKLSAKGGTPTVVGTFGTVSADLVVDSGSSTVALPPSVWNALLVDGSVVPSRDLIKTITFTMADGHTKERAIYRVPSLTIGGITAKNVLCNIAETEDGGLLGESFLSQFSSWTIDNTHGVLRLTQ